MNAQNYSPLFADRNVLNELSEAGLEAARALAVAGTDTTIGLAKSVTLGAVAVSLVGVSVTYAANAAIVHAPKNPQELADFITSLTTATPEDVADAEDNGEAWDDSFSDLDDEVRETLSH